MDYKSENLKEGIKFHNIKTDKFKTNIFSVFFTVPLQRETVTQNALLSLVLRRGTKRLPTQEKISEKLEEMYGADFDCGIEKTGDYQVLKFYIEAINDKFLPSSEKLSDECINILFDIILNPLLENGNFKEEYVNSEKFILKQIIEGKIDNKAKYALDRCIEEMYKGKPSELYKYGYAEDLENITAKSLYEQYINVIKTAKIDIFVSGDVEGDVKESVINNQFIKELLKRNFEIKDSEQFEEVERENVVTESMQIKQGKLIMGLNVLKTCEEYKFVASVYNGILGGGANSKMFQNVREKASLAYTAGSSFLRNKDNIFIKCGIDIKNYSKAVEIIKNQLEQMKAGEFTNEDIMSAKKLITSTIDGIPESQDSEIAYCFGQEFDNKFVTIEEYINNINNVIKDQIVELAKKIKIDTIYFLKD